MDEIREETNSAEAIRQEIKEQKVECSRFSKEFPIWSLETAKLRMKNKLEK